MNNALTPLARIHTLRGQGYTVAHARTMLRYCGIALVTVKRPTLAAVLP